MSGTKAEGGAEVKAKAEAKAEAEADNVKVVSSLLTPALMVYYLCCWPGDAKSDTSSEKNTRRSVSRNESVSRRASELFTKRLATSAVSLHLPSTSGHKKETLSAHRSHEEIGRRKSHLESVPSGEASRYHSAPSVIDEVLHRRDWERSTRELHIPLRSPADGDTSSHSDADLSPLATAPAPRAEPESSSIHEHPTDEQIVRTCKKHYTNIKSSKRKEKEVEDKDCDATELTDFYIGDNDANVSNSDSPARELVVVGHKAKEAKQSFNESIRSKERPRPSLVPLDEHRPNVFAFRLDDVIDRLETLDRSGATHHTIESRISLSKPPYPPPSVEAVGYEGGACYLAERGQLRPQAGAGAGAGAVAGAVAGAGAGMRARHASDGDILAPPCRPESGAFSESDLDLELESTDERPPPYDQLQHFTTPEKKETAI